MERIRAAGSTATALIGGMQTELIYDRRHLIGGMQTELVYDRRHLIGAGRRNSFTIVGT